MMRVLLLGFVLVATACGSPKTFPSLCNGQASQPSACSQACDPAPGSTNNDCPTGFHCSADSKCDTVCTLSGNECGKGYLCTADGHCVSDGSGSGSGDPPDMCPSVQFTATKVTPSIQIVFDRSGSMKENFSGQNPNAGMDNGPYKFPTEQDALIGTQGVVTQLQGGVYFGISMYPSDACPGVFQTPRTLNNQSAIASLVAAHGPSGNTPTPAAINAAVADFMTNKPPPGSPPVILLSTDGLPNDCNGQNGAQARTDTIAAAKSAFTNGIRLFLLVVGNQIDATFKRDVANAGQGVQTGQPDAKAYTATDPATLSTALQEIIRGVVSCDLKLNGRVDPNNAQGGVVRLNGTTLTYNTDWKITPDGLGITLLGNACNMLKAATNPMVDATFSCGAVIF